MVQGRELRPECQGRDRLRRDGACWLHEHKPKLIIAGASAYSLRIDFERFAKVAKAIGAYFMVDMAHYAGLIAAGVYPNPVPFADVVTSTTHKSLRGPRGGFILMKDARREGHQQRDLPGHPGRPADACDRRQGGCLQGSAAAPSSRPTSSRWPATPQTLAETLTAAWPAHRERPHREPRDAGRPAAQRASPARRPRRCCGQAQ